MVDEGREGKRQGGGEAETSGSDGGRETRAIHPRGCITALKDDLHQLDCTSDNERHKKFPLAHCQDRTYSHAFKVIHSNFILQNSGVPRKMHSRWSALFRA